ncbi:multicopper oxidase domain-containing protein [Streptomyces sp. NPDC006430]|uniref:multicopper oxidase domain-containing protein n=1 Tax=Streptomyces sp. NPDC006430 TaxID=3154299 RepID=UPI0033B57AD9
MVAAWLLLFAVAALAHPFVAEARWLLVHLLLLGAVTNAVVIWSGHFAASVLRLPESDRGAPAAFRLAGLNAGAVAVVAGMLAGFWPAVLAGGTAVAVAVAVHAVWLVRLLRRALPGRFAMTVRYYIAASALLPLGAALGVIMARGGLSDDIAARVLTAHKLINLLGWLGLTVAGTLVTLWPTMLRTRVADGAERAARRALPVLLGGLGAAVAAVLTLPPPAAAAGVAVFAGGLVVAGIPWVREAQVKSPSSFATWSVAAGGAWLLGTLAALVVTLLTSASWPAVAERTASLTAPLAAGWMAQVLLGALSFLVPVVLGGGPAAVRATTAELDRGGPARLTAANAALLLCVLPVPGMVRVACSVVLLGVLVTFLVLLVRTVRSHRARQRDTRGTQDAPPASPTAPPASPQRPHRVLGGAAAGLAVVVLAAVAGSAMDVRSLPVAAPSGSAATAEGGQAVTPTGRTTTVAVTIRGMRFAPDTVQVPRGNRLVIKVHNLGTDRHDLVLDTGAHTGRLAPGERATLDAGTVGHDLEGWCSVVGHRQMGMVFAVRATGTASTPTPTHTGHAMGGDTTGNGSGTAKDSAANAFDPMAEPPAGFAGRDAQLPPAQDGTAQQVHRRTLTVRDVVREVAPGVRQTLWTFDGTAPGPVLRGRVGDTFEITLVNGGTTGHSVDFHAGALAPDRPMRTIQPGQSLTYRFTATRSGVWMYHCSTMPMSLHIANGMFGAVVIDPPDLPRVDREYLIVQSELYLGAQGGTADPDKLVAGRPDAVVFNGYANQYSSDGLAARVGERIRVWVLDAGPNRGSAFHVVGGQFDTVYQEGAYRLRPDDPGHGGAQILDVAPGSGGFVELSFPEAGNYPFVSHIMSDAERGARGMFKVTAR